MKANKQMNICLIVTCVRGSVVVDGPNIIHENICKLHDRRNCPSCKRKHKNYNDENYWDRTFDLHRLEILESALAELGYKAIIWIKWGTYSYARRKAKKFPEIQFSLLQKMVDKGSVITPKPESDDIWWITLALKLDALILTNDTFKDKIFKGEVVTRERTNYPDLDWSDIDDRTYEFQFQPETCLRDEEQEMLIPDLPKHPDLTPEEIRKAKISKLKKQLEELVAEEAEDDEANLDRIREFAMTTNEEMSEENHTFHDEIIQSWDMAFKGGGGQAICYHGHSSIWNNLILNICGIPAVDYNLSPINPDHEFVLDYGLREKLGYSKNTSWRTILENQLVIYSEYTGREIKFVNNPFEIGSVGERVYLVDTFPELENIVEQIKKNEVNEDEE